MELTAVCTCGDEWTLEGNGQAATSRLDARVAVMFAVDRKSALAQYNGHIAADRKKHPKGR